MSRRLFRPLAAVLVLAGGGCALIDRQLGRALGETEAEYQRRRADDERAESFERAGMSQRAAAELAAQTRATDAALETGNTFRLWK